MTYPLVKGACDAVTPLWDTWTATLSYSQIIAKCITGLDDRFMWTNYNSPPSVFFSARAIVHMHVQPLTKPGGDVMTANVWPGSIRLQ